MPHCANRGVDGSPSTRSTHVHVSRRRVGSFAADAAMAGSQIIEHAIGANNHHRVDGKAVDPTARYFSRLILSAGPSAGLPKISR